MESATVLMTTAVSVAFVHTLIGIDHSLPFVMIGKARKWSLKKIWAITALCGVGHVLSSILLGGVGIGLGVALEKLEWIEGSRGTFASYLLITFGLVYAAWAFIRSARNKRHSHGHVHSDGTLHKHEHAHQEEHLHAHEAISTRKTVVWSLFIIFVFGPCEPLIPLLMAPAATHAWWTLIAVTALFAFVTIGTMLLAVTCGYYGLKMSWGTFLERHIHVAAGLMIAASGFAIQLFGI